MSWDSDDYKQHREAQQQRRAERLPDRVKEIMELSQVVKLTDYQFRIDGWIDLYPIHKRYHILKTNKRGNYTHIKVGKIYSGKIELKNEKL